MGLKESEGTSQLVFRGGPVDSRGQWTASLSADHQRANVPFCGWVQGTVKENASRCEHSALENRQGSFMITMQEKG